MCCTSGVTIKANVTNKTWCFMFEWFFYIDTKHFLNFSCFTDVFFVTLFCLLHSCLHFCHFVFPSSFSFFSPPFRFVFALLSSLWISSFLISVPLHLPYLFSVSIFLFLFCQVNILVMTRVLVITISTAKRRSIMLAMGRSPMEQSYEQIRY